MTLREGRLLGSSVAIKSYIGVVLRVPGGMAVKVWRWVYSGEMWHFVQIVVLGSDVAAPGVGLSAPGVTLGRYR